MQECITNAICNYIFIFRTFIISSNLTICVHIVWDGIFDTLSMVFDGVCIIPYEWGGEFITVPITAANTGDSYKKDQFFHGKLNLPSNAERIDNIIKP